MIPMTLILLAHAFYAPDCCGGRDCHPVACEEIVTTKDGWQWQHRIWFSRYMMRVSQDGGCHVCVAQPEFSTVPPYGVCIYLPPQT